MSAKLIFISFVVLFFLLFFIELHLVRPATFCFSFKPILAAQFQHQQFKCLHCEGFAVADPTPDWTFLRNKQV